MDMTQTPIIEQKKQDDPVRAWFSHGVGQEMLTKEQAVLDRILSGLYGSHLVQIGIEPTMDLCRKSTIPHKFMIYHQLELGMKSSTMVALSNELPIEHNSMDVVVLHHALDFSNSPHQVLREAARILRPGGHIVIVGFNPISWWGLRRKTSRKQVKPVWHQAQFISHGRLSDWINLLELTELKTESHFFWPPFQTDKIRHRFGWAQGLLKRSLPTCGAMNIVLARKDVGSMRLINMRRRTRRFIQIPVAEPATRGQTRGTR
jgi:SAM-dependent methyltransferase